MTIAATLLLVLCYIGAGYLAWARRTPIYLLGLLSGHLSALVSPLWQIAYDFTYLEGFPDIAVILGQGIPREVLLGSGWHYPLPALVVLALFQYRWWFPGQVSAILTFGVMFGYHLLIETIGVRVGAWFYPTVALPIELPITIIPALLATLITALLLNILLNVQRSDWLTMALVLLPATLGLSLAINGIIGAPFWLPLLLGVVEWAVLIGVVGCVGLIIWGSFIAIRGMSQPIN